MVSDPIRSSPAARRGHPGGRWLFPLLVAATAAAGMAAATGASPLGVWVFVLVLGGWLVTLCLHEFGHAVTALAGGDVSVRSRGYLTLNPMRYSNAVMTFLLPLVILAVGGIPLPGGAVVIEHVRLRSALWRSAVSAAGPAVNLVLWVVLSILSTVLPLGLGAGLAFLAVLQFIAAILNLLPVPGLDGWGILSPYLSANIHDRVRPFVPWAPLALLIVLVSLPDVARPLFSTARWMFEASGGSPSVAAVGEVLFHFWR
jgi:Zn-dependent protease